MQRNDQPQVTSHENYVTLFRLKEALRTSIRETREQNIEYRRNLHQLREEITNIAEQLANVHTQMFDFYGSLLQMQAGEDADELKRRFTHLRTHVKNTQRQLTNVAGNILQQQVDLAY